MAAKKMTAMDFIVASLKKNPMSAYADIAKAAAKKRLKVYPIMFGRAQALLGIVKAAKRGEGKAAKAKSGTPAVGRGRRADPTSKSGRIRELLGSGLSAAEIAKKVGATPGLVYSVKASMGKAGKRGPGRPRGAATPPLDGIAVILEAVRNSERQRTRLHDALDRVRVLINGVLAS